MARQDTLLGALQSSLLKPLEQGRVMRNPSVPEVTVQPQPAPQQVTPVGSVFQNDFYNQKPQTTNWYEMKSGVNQIGQMQDEDQPWYKDRDLMTRLALGFNTMRLNPDQALAAVLSDELKTSRELRAGNKTAQSVANALRAKGFNDEAMLVEQNPALAKEFAKLVTKGSTNTEAIQTREQTAKLLGYEPDSPEYRAIIAGGTPSDISKEAWEKSKSVRGEFVAIPAVKSFSEQAQAFGRIVASAEDPSPAGDLALIFNFMKVLDPGSTVREGEFANAQNAGGIDDKVRGLYNQIINGKRLSEVQRSDFVGRAQRLYGNAEQGYAQTEKFYKGVAERAGLKPEEVIPNYRYGGSKPPKMLAKPAEVPQETWDSMTRQQKQQFLDAGR